MEKLIIYGVVRMLRDRTEWASFHKTEQGAQRDRDARNERMHANTIRYTVTGIEVGE